MAEEKKTGVVTHFYDHLSVGIVKLSAALKVGDAIHVKGKHTDFTQTVNSIQLEHKELQSAKAKSEVGIKMDQKAREGDEVFLMSA